MVLPGLSEERWMIPSPKSPKRLKLRLRDITVSPHDSQKRNNGDADGEGCRSPARKFNDSTASASSKRTRTPTRRIDEEYDCGIENMRKNLVFDLNVAADRMRKATLEENKEKQEARESSLCEGGSQKKHICSSTESPDGAIKLSKRRRVSRETQTTKARESPLSDRGSEKKHKCSSTETTDGAVKSSKRRRISRETPRTKLSVQLSREEIEEDFTKIAGRRLPRKPNKRPSVVQNRLDALFPGSLLTEVTADLYKVPESPVRHCWKKKRNNRKTNDV